MPKKTSTKTDSVTAPVVAAPVVAAPVVEAAATDKKVKKPKTPKVETAPVPVPVPTPVVELAVEETTPVDGDAVLIEQSTEFLTKLQQISTMIASLKVEYRTLEKKWTRELKAAQKQSNKRKRKAGSRAPSGFVKPTRISEELATFLDKPAGSEMARTEVTRDINKYIRTNKLQDETNGRKINPDSKLAALLKLKKTDELTYFNLQRYMSPHFAKAVKADASTL
jgi:upstream activation factor subunit UAF30